MRRYLLILVVILINKATLALDITYRVWSFSAIRQKPITFGTVRLCRPSGGGRNGKEIGKIDSVGFFTVKLKDSINVCLEIDCVLAGNEVKTVSYTDTVIIFTIKADCRDYNVEIAMRDIENNKIFLLCDLGYATYKFSDADRVFEKKYKVQYYSFGDEPIMSDCMWLYNQTIAEYLDNKLGKEWRNEVRWDVPLN